MALFGKSKTETDTLAERRQEIEKLLTERARLKQNADQCATAARAAQNSLARTETDGQALLALSDDDVEAERRKVRGLLRDEARAQNASRDFEAQHSDLDTQLEALKADEQQAAQKEMQAQYRETLRRFVELGDALAAQQAALNAAVGEAKQRWPGQTVLRSVNLPGVLTGAGEGLLPDATWWRWVRCLVASVEPGLFAADDRVHQEVAVYRATRGSAAPYGPWKPVLAGFERDSPPPG